VTDKFGSRELSKKEWRIVELVAEGLGNKDIAVRVGNTELVLKNYLRVIYDKTGMFTRLELALWYVSREGQVTS
jgi:two-component system, NarL family, nitrate/nitrite response regulator NarL